jgi:hypothetical protein
LARDGGRRGEQTFGLVHSLGDLARRFDSRDVCVEEGTTHKKTISRVAPHSNPSLVHRLQDQRNMGKNPPLTVVLR